MPKQEYFLSSQNKYVRIEDFNSLSEDEITELIEEWLETNFEDPAERCPCEGGEYYYIYGSPVRADEVIYEEFEDIVSTNLLKKILINIPERYEDLTPIPDYKWSDYTSNDPHLVFKEHMDNIKRLSVISNRDQNLQSKYLGLLFINIITTFEAFMVDTLIDNLHDCEKCVIRFIDSKLFNDDKKKEYKQDYKQYWKTIVNKINYTTFHSEKYIKIFIESLDLSITINFSKIKKYTNIRNDIVHRNGKAKRINEQPSSISKTMTLEFLNECIFFIESTVKDINSGIYDSDNLDINEPINIKTANIRI